MGTYDAVEIQGEERQKALDAFKTYLAGWQLSMPEVVPLFLHFGLNDFYHTGLVEYWVANETTLGYCGKFLFVFDGQTCPFHAHKMKHETFFVVKGCVRMKTDNQEMLLKQGDRLVMPPGVGHSFTGVGPALLLEVSLPSILQDNFFTDKRIGNNGVI
jgi:mannose-6-phosphate isomerase-like protein (cupin superfamily)